ncbi:uncharacterized protein LOC110980510 [Acanthaster planci]|uniref:Uncharacterized protein LOC110980510 n=1 Tax=Acanthaster planci TaxID=133434 RepID=A0A8B7YKK7_ACAPL|nr:uncharacterized protein LOC110980510 [Acanthaster planci]
MAALEAEVVSLREIQAIELEELKRRQKRRSSLSRPRWTWQSGRNNLWVGVYRVVQPIVAVKVSALEGSSSFDTYALLDNGPTSTEELASQLNIDGKRQSLTLITIAKTKKKIKTTVISLVVRSFDRQAAVNLEKVYTRQAFPINDVNITESEDVKKWPHARGINTPQVEKGKVQLLIGQDSPEALMPLERVIALWEKTLCPKGRHYELPISLKNDQQRLVDNRIVAEQRLTALGRRLEKDHQLKSRYTEDIKELVNNGFAEEVAGDDRTSDTTTWYLPHHPVLDSGKQGNMRIVFDCAVIKAQWSILEHADNQQARSDEQVTGRTPALPTRASGCNGRHSSHVPPGQSVTGMKRCLALFLVARR